MKLREVEEEGLKQQAKIRQILDDYTSEIAKNPTYIAYSLLDNDPLNDNSVECLCSQSEIWKDVVSEKLRCESLDHAMEDEYQMISISFSEAVFDNALKELVQVYNKMAFKSSMISPNTGSSGPGTSSKSGFRSSSRKSFRQMRQLSAMRNQTKQMLEKMHEPVIPPPTSQLEQVDLINMNVVPSDGLGLLGQGSPMDLFFHSHLEKNLEEAKGESLRAPEFNALEVCSGFKDSFVQNDLPDAIHQSEFPSVQEHEIDEANVLDSHVGIPQPLTTGQRNFISMGKPPEAPQAAMAPKAQKPPTLTRSPVKKKVSIPDSFRQQALGGEVDLSSKNLSDAHSNQLVNLIKQHAATGVRSLDLSGNKISDAGVMDIVRAICESQIEQVSLARNKLTEKSAEPIAQTLKSNKHLKSLDLSENLITSRVAKNKLVNSLKKVEVIV